MKKGRLLPKLYGNTLSVIDFFEVPSEKQKYDLIIGNPPWVSRRDNSKSAEKWCIDNQRKMPAKEIAWGFAWKALTHTNNSVIALLLKATSFITSQSQTIVETRKEWISCIKLVRIVNFADTRFQLFKGVSAPTALIIYKPKSEETDTYKFDYWVPKADLNLKTKRLMTLSSIDKSKLSSHLVMEDQLLMKRRMWMQTPDAKVFQFLNNFPKLSRKIVTHQNSGKNTSHNKWVIGQGFNPAQEHRLEEPNYRTTNSEIITKIPHLEMKMYRPIVMPTVVNEGWHTKRVYRKNFENGYSAPHVLIPQGIERNSGRLRASYCSQDLSFRTSIQAISFDKESTDDAKFLTVFLNSSLASWLLFHNSSVTGVERNKVPQQDILELPYPLVEHLSNTEKANAAFQDAVSLINNLLKEKDELLQSGISDHLKDIDKIIYQYFDLSKADILLIEDGLKHIIPSMQPREHSKKPPSLWEDTNSNDWKYYSKWLSFGLIKWLEEPKRAVVELCGASADLVVIGVHLTNDPERKYFKNNRTNNIDQILPKIWDSLPQSMPGNFQLIPDLRVFIDDVLYIVKPRKRRFWLGSTALADADSIASDLLATSSKGSI